jgi:hypothetical protein
MENRKLNWKSFNWFRPKREKMARHPAYRTNIKTAKAWAANVRAHLGLNKPKRTSIIHCRSTAEHDSRRNKTVARPLPRNPSVISFTFSPPLSPPKPSERGGQRSAAGRPEVRRRPLAGVQHSPEGERTAVEPARGSALSQDPGTQHYVVASEWRCHPWGRLSMRDAHPRVSAPPSSRLVTVPFCGDQSRHAGDPTSGGGCAVERCPSRSLSWRSKMTNLTWRRGKTPTSLGLGFGFLLRLISIWIEPIPLLLNSSNCCGDLDLELGRRLMGSWCP